MPKKPKLTAADLVPADVTQCQAEKPNGHTFMTLGGKPGRVRCKAVPFVIATEAKKGKDGLVGTMSLCKDCFQVFQKQMPKGFATFEACQ